MQEILVITGHYGSGKTTVSLNFAYDAARDGKSVTLADMDIVNPYFRSGDSAAELRALGVRVLAPAMLGTTSDAPSIRAELMSAFDSPTELTIFDAGGDDAGSAVLGRFHERFGESGYKMLYVFNPFRPLTKTPADCAEILREIEAASRLRASGLILNANIGAATTASDITGSLPFAGELEKLTGLPLAAVTVQEELLPELDGKIGCLRGIRRLVLPPWGNEG
jgi:hypothetical protein